MAKQKPAAVEADNLTDLLGDDNTPDPIAEAKAAAKKAQDEAKAKIKEIQDKAKQEAKELKEKAKAKAEAAKEAAKGEKKTKEAKGEMVSFTNQAGETITGKGVLYYVVRAGGKLHYKEASKVTVLEHQDVEVSNDKA